MGTSPWKVHFGCVAGCTGSFAVSVGEVRSFSWTVCRSGSFPFGLYVRIFDRNVRTNSINNPKRIATKHEQVSCLFERFFFHIGQASRRPVHSSAVVTNFIRLSIVTRPELVGSRSDCVSQV